MSSIDPEHVRSRTVTWQNPEAARADGAGKTGLEIMRGIRDGTLAGPQQDSDGGNGALMRNLPVALATLGDDALFDRVSLDQSHITHHHPESDAAVLGIGRLLRAQLAGTPALAEVADAWVTAHPVFRFKPYPRRASGYVVDTVQTVLHCVTTHSDFESAVTAAVNLGDDADTTGALVGMLAGARCGARALPQRWLRRLLPEVRQAVTAQAHALVDLSVARQMQAQSALDST